MIDIRVDTNAQELVVVDGQVVSAGGNKLVVLIDGDERTFDVAGNAKVTLDGKPVELNVLGRGRQVRISLRQKTTTQ